MLLDIRLFEFGSLRVWRLPAMISTFVDWFLLRAPIFTKCSPTPISCAHGCLLGRSWAVEEAEERMTPWRGEKCYFLRKWSAKIERKQLLWFVSLDHWITWYFFNFSRLCQADHTASWLTALGSNDAEWCRRGQDMGLPSFWCPEMPWVNRGTAGVETAILAIFQLRLVSVPISGHQW